MHRPQSKCVSALSRAVPLKSCGVQLLIAYSVGIGQIADISDAYFSLQSHKTERVHGHVLEPCKISVHVDMAKGTGDVRLQISDVHIRVSPDVLELGASLQASVLEPLIQPSADRCHALKSLFILNVSVICKPAIEHDAPRSGVQANSASVAAGAKMCKMCKE